MRYCSKCKYYNVNEYGDICNSNPAIEDSHDRRSFRYSRPDLKNKENNCVEYESKLYLKLLKKIQEFTLTVLK